MLRSYYVVSLFLIGLMVGCAGNPTAENAVRMANEDAERSGNPYRWVAKVGDNGTAIMRKRLIGTPAPTAADPVLTDDVLAAIEKLEVQAGMSGKLQLIETRRVSIEAGGVREVWVISRGNKNNAAYTVTMVPSPKGGVDLSINGPW